MKKASLTLSFIAVMMVTPWKLYCQYETVTIGKKVWMKKNLEVDKFRNGDPIPQVKSDSEWEAAGNNKQAAWCYYENYAANGSKYGKLYNWYAVNDSRGLTPVGWHVSKMNEWKEIEKNLGENSEWIAGMKIRHENMWYACSGSNETGFSALPGGSRDEKGKFNNEFDDTGNLGWWGCWWNIDEVSKQVAMYTELNGGCMDGGYIGSYQGNKSMGMSIRCVKD